MYTIKVGDYQATAGDINVAYTTALIHSEDEKLPWTIEWNPDV